MRGTLINVNKTWGARWSRLGGTLVMLSPKTGGTQVNVSHRSDESEESGAHCPRIDIGAKREKIDRGAR